MAERTYNVLALELRMLLTFDNRGNSPLVLTRALFVNNEIYKPFVLNSRAQGISGKKSTIYLNTMARGPRGAGPQRRGTQCGGIGCIGLRPALPTDYGVTLSQTGGKWQG